MSSLTLNLKHTLAVIVTVFPGDNIILDGLDSAFSLLLLQKCKLLSAIVGDKSNNICCPSLFPYSLFLYYPLTSNLWTLLFFCIIICYTSLTIVSPFPLCLFYWRLLLFIFPPPLYFQLSLSISSFWTILFLNLTFFFVFPSSFTDFSGFIQRNSIKI